VAHGDTILFVHNWLQINLYLYKVSPIAIGSQSELISLMTYSILPGVSTRPVMTEGKDAETIPYVNSGTCFGNVRIDKGVDRLIYICDTNMEDGHR